MKKSQAGISISMFSAGIALVLIASMAPQAKANTIAVDGTNCTLASAITSANSDRATGNCSAGSGADTIALQADVTLTEPLPAVTTVITIAGNDHAISGDNQYQVLQNDRGDLTVTNTTISDGNGFFGGGIYNRNGHLTLDNCTISGNTAGTGGGILNHSNGSDTATVTITNSTISGNTAAYSGGGIMNYSDGYYGGDTATVTITNSTISGNTASGHGGGIMNYSGGGYHGGGTATAAITNSTISGNTAAFSGGGIMNESYNGGAATATITNSTISGNTASDNGGGIGIFSYGGTAPLTISASTISGNTAGNNGGGIDNHIYSYSYDQLAIKGCLISGNQVGDAGLGAELFNSIPNGQNPRSLRGYNLLGHSGLTTFEAFQGIILTPTDVTATSDSNTHRELNAIVGTLAANGGTTLTHALPFGSPAIDLVPRSECGTVPFNKDQRGSVRPYGNGCDAGSYEYKDKSNLLLMIVPVISGVNKN